MNIEEKNDCYVVNFTMMGNHYTEIFNKSGEYVKFIGNEFEPWKKHILEIICEYKNDFISDPNVKKIMKKLVNGISEMREAKSDLLTKNDMILTLEQESEENKSKLSEIQQKIEIERKNEKNKNFITKGGKYILKVLGGASQKYIPIDQFNVDGCKKSLTNVISSFSMIDPELVSLGIDVLYLSSGQTGKIQSSENLLDQSQEKRTVNSKANQSQNPYENLLSDQTGDHSNIPEDLKMKIERITEKFKIEDKNGFSEMIRQTIESGDIKNVNFGRFIRETSQLDNILSSIDTGHISFGNHEKFNGELDINYLNELSERNPEFHSDIENIKSIRENQITKEAIIRKNQENETEMKNKQKLLRLKSIQKQFQKQGMMFLMVLIVSCLIFIISLIVSFVKFSLIHVKFSSNHF